MRLIIPILIALYLGFRSYQHAATQLQVTFDPVIDITTYGQPKLVGSITITNPTGNPFYADSALFDISANGNKIAIAEITQPVFLPAHGDIELQPLLTLSHNALATFLQSLQGKIEITINGIINVGPVAIPVSFTKKLV